MLAVQEQRIEELEEQLLNAKEREKEKAARQEEAIAALRNEVQLARDQVCIFTLLCCI